MRGTLEHQCPSGAVDAAAPPGGTIPGTHLELR